MNHHVAATTPYPWPFDGDLAGPATALLVVVAPGTGRPDAGLAATIGRLARAVKWVGGTVLVATTTAPARLSPSSSDVSPTAPIGTLLGGESADGHIAAGGIDAFYASDLDLVLHTRGISRLLLAGTGLETAVHSTMRDANDRGYECLLVVDACEPVEPGLVGSAVSMIEMSGGIFGAVGRASDTIDALLAARAAPGVPAVSPPAPLRTEGAHR